MQKTALTEVTHELYEDSILLDRLLHLVNGDFEGHQRQINDGRSNTLEILNILKPEQMETDRVAGTLLGKLLLNIIHHIELRNFWEWDD